MKVDLPAGGGVNPPPAIDDTRERKLDGSPEPDGERVPERTSGLQLIGHMKGSGYRNPPSLVRRSDGQVIQLTPLLYAVLEAIDGSRDVDAIAGEASRMSGRMLSPANVSELIDGKLRPLGLVRLPDGTEPSVRKVNPLLALRFRLVLSNPRLTRRITAPFAFLFHPLIVAVLVAGFAVAAWWVLAQRGLGFAASQAFSNPALLLTVFLVGLVSAGFHEFGHAAGARYGGATPGAIGAGLYLLWPAFYTDVTDSYRLGRGGRLRTDLGGLYFNAVLALAVFGLWWITGWEALLLLIPIQILQMIKQLPPLLRFDGYHLLADITGVPDLYYRIKPTLLGFLPKYWKRPESKVLKPWAKAVVTLWVIIVVPFMALSLFITVITMPRIVASAWASLNKQWLGMTFFFGHGDIQAGLVRMLGVIAIGLPVAGITYLLIRLLRSLIVKAIRSTAGNPLKRAGASAIGAVAIGALMFAWWPHGNYRPIQPYERGTIQDAMPAVFRSQGLHKGDVRTARVVWPERAGALPTSAHPVLALVLIPKAGQTASSTGQTGSQSLPTWVFPFNRPAAPGPGDNQALAVNTTNGSSVYQVAFALVWANSSQPVLNTNSAYAFADCQYCATTAVAFQVVLVVGDAHIVAPQNLAGVLNYSCLSCVSQALADQLVLTLPQSPSPQEIAAIDAVWSQVEAFGQKLQGLSFAQIESQLSTYEAQLTAIVNQYSPPGTAGSATSPTTVSSSSSTVVSGSTPTTAGMTSTTTSSSTGTTATTPPTTSSSSPSTTTATTVPTTSPSTTPTTAPPTTSPPST